MQGPYLRLALALVLAAAALWAALNSGRLDAAALTDWIASLGMWAPVIFVALLAAKANQKTPEGFYNVERMLKRVLAGKGQVLLCGTCMDARGITDAELMQDARRSTMDELADATVLAW